MPVFNSGRFFFKMVVYRCIISVVIFSLETFGADTFLGKKIEQKDDMGMVSAKLCEDISKKISFILNENREEKNRRRTLENDVRILKGQVEHLTKKNRVEKIQRRALEEDVKEMQKQFDQFKKRKIEETLLRKKFEEDTLKEIDQLTKKNIELEKISNNVKSNLTLNFVKFKKPGVSLETYSQFLSPTKQPIRKPKESLVFKSKVSPQYQYSEADKHENMPQTTPARPKRLLLPTATPPSTGTHLPRVAFFAKLGSFFGNFGAEQVIKFDSVVTNVGNCYHSKTGIFMCNVPGTYVFYYEILSSNGLGLDTTIYKDGAVMARTRSHNPHDYDSGSNMIIVRLNAGESIWIASRNNVPAANVICPEGYSTFSGFLLYNE